MQTTEDATNAPAYDARQAARTPEAAARTAPALPRREFVDDPRRKSPNLAFVLSAMPGLGQVYVGYYQQGFANAVIVASLITLLNNGAVRGAEPLFGLFLAFYWLYNAVDAWRRAVFYNNALAGIGPASLPDDFTIAPGRGSLGGGLALIAVGVVLLSHTLFNVPLDWVERWWPVGFLLVGAWLAYPAFVRPRKHPEA